MTAATDPIPATARQSQARHGPLWRLRARLSRLATGTARRMSSSLTRRIVFLNLAGLAVMLFGSWLPFVWKASAATWAALCRWLVPLREEGWPPHNISARRASGADSLQDGGVDALAILGCLRLDQHRRTDRAAMYQFKHRLWPITGPDKIDAGRQGSLKSVPQ